MHQVSLNLIKLHSQNIIPNTHLEEGISFLTTTEADDSETDSCHYLRQGGYVFAICLDFVL